jgi:hypothetical protein
MILEETGLEYQSKPSSPVIKLMWLVEYYDCEIPALRRQRVYRITFLNHMDQSEIGTRNWSAMDVFEAFFSTDANFVKVYQP